MEIYDSHEEEEACKNMSENLKKLHDFFRSKTKDEIDAFFLNIVVKAQEINERITPLLEKLKLKTISDEEIIILRETRQEVINTLKQFDDLALLLTYSVTVQAEGIMFHIKELAEKGNLKAKETYDKLYPSYLEHLRESISGPEAEN